MTLHFIVALKAIMERGNSITRICEETGIDRRNLSRLVRTPGEHYPRPQWLVALCTVYSVSPSFLILGEGEIFTR